MNATQAQLDRVKRRALLGPDAACTTQPPVQSFNRPHHLDSQPRQAVAEVDIGAVVDGMEATGVNLSDCLDLHT